MGMRVLSGVIAPSDPVKGSATVVFESNLLSGDVNNTSPNDHNRRTVGDAGRFKAPPAFTVALREVRIVESADTKKRVLNNLRGDLAEEDWLAIGTDCKRDHLTVYWDTTKEATANNELSGQESRSEIIELHYMVIGEV